MKILNLPSYEFKTKQINGKQEIFDSVRRKFVVLTPEEWVRQNFIQYLIQEKNFPAGLIAVEKEISLNNLIKRADIAIYNSKGETLLVVECKSPKIRITQDTFEQVSRYNLVYKAPYLIITNGLEHYCTQINFKRNKIEFLKEIPDYLQLKHNPPID